MLNKRRGFLARAEALWIGGGLAGALTVLAIAQVPTTINDFFLPGTQPNGLDVAIQDANDCRLCHGDFDPDQEPYRPWAASAMGQAARDPLFFAAMAIANQDAAFAGDLCLRCHTPGGWLAGRSTPTDGSLLQGIDFQGVACNFCHRTVDPFNNPGAPIEDADILANLANPPLDAHSGNFVIDPQDRRRGPYELVDFFVHDWRQSPFHLTSEMCATCHDVSNPAFERQPDGTYAPGALDTPHSTSLKEDMFPIERTYSEWLASDFADGPIEMGGRFGGNITAVSTCQDCHMPKTEGYGCIFGDLRSDLPQHQFNGGNTWLLNAVRTLYSDVETGLENDSVAASIARTVYLLEAASDMELTQNGSNLNVHIINQTGHKLPSGYPEGRRMWINVQFYDDMNTLLAERGAYDFGTAVLTTADTKVYEAKLGVSADVAGIAGVPAGEGFHFAVNNMRLKDNRIPPRGFTNAGFEAAQSEPVGYAYADGDYWDDTEYTIPVGATSADVRVYYQSTSKEYVEFLKNENQTNDAGDIMHQAWLDTGMSAPVVMDMGTITFQTGCNAADIAEPYNVLDLQDVQAFIAGFLAHDPVADIAPPYGVFDLADLQGFIAAFLAGCP
ncbi:MAG: hypothetical protein H6810_10650 [Phycisphaeraceae bacterium]|nr:MAG: hypothetical protein H6810_10650 [Phycisphaeraceae bacterium]